METSVLLVSDGLAHPSLLGRFWLRRGLAAMAGYRFRRVASLEALPGLTLGSFQGILLYIHHETLSPSALESLEGFVRQGGGLLAVHSASASFKQEERYFAILGGSFREHGPIEPFQVEPVTPQDEIFRGIPAFFVTDELYRHDYDPDNRVHFYTPVGEEREPVVWTRRHGQGRVCYCALGHTAATMRYPQVQRILQQGVAWACGKLPGPDAADPE
jgi:type 1 glutamine amidotransferase